MVEFMPATTKRICTPETALVHAGRPLVENCRCGQAKHAVTSEALQAAEYVPALHALQLPDPASAA
eukprot:392853-Rhodomonas_salina.1